MPDTHKHTHHRRRVRRRHSNQYVFDGSFADEIADVEPLPHARLDESGEPVLANETIPLATDEEDLSSWDGELPNESAAPNAEGMRKKHRRKRRKKRMSTAKKVLIGVLCTLVGVLAVTACASAFFVQSIGDEISFAPQEQEAIKEALAPVPEADNSFYMLVAAVDDRDVEAEDELEGRTDTLILVRVDPDKKITTLVTIPRDTPWTNAQGEIHRINDAMVQGGAPMMIEAIQNLTGAPISHYAEINFVGFRNIIDLVGGVTVDIPQDLTVTNFVTGNTYNLAAGKQEITSDIAEALVRVRKPYYGGDATRQRVNRQILLNVVQRMAQMSPLDLPGAIQVVAESIGTDMSVGEMASLAPTLLGDMTVYQAAGPYEGDYNAAVRDMWLCYENPTGWARLMEMVDAGQDPSGISYVDDPVVVAGTGGQVPATRPNIDTLN